MRKLNLQNDRQLNKFQKWILNVLNIKTITVTEKIFIKQRVKKAINYSNQDFENASSKKCEDAWRRYGEYEMVD